MNISIHSFIPSPASYYKEGRKEYEKRLSRYCKIKHNIYKNEKQLAKVIEKTKQLPFEAGKDTVILVSARFHESDIDSPGLASYIEEKAVMGISNLHFFIGFDDSHFYKTEIPLEQISISHMTIPADLLSLILEEQIYRAYRIIKKEPYHK